MSAAGFSRRQRLWPELWCQVNGSGIASMSVAVLGHCQSEGCYATKCQQCSNMDKHYTPWVKKGDTILLSISLLNVDRFSQFFHWRTQLELCNKIINKDPTSPQMCCYTTLWNVPTSSAPAHRARETIKLLQRETPAFISPDLWPPNRPDLNPVNYKICGVMQDRVYQKKVKGVNELRERLVEVWPDCYRTWLTMPSTSGADACVPAFGLEEDILSICCDWLH